MKIGVISDTHGDAEIFKKILNTYFRDVDIILHAGDILYHGPLNPISPGYSPPKLAQAINELKIPIIIAKGNCDNEADEGQLKVPVHYPWAIYEIEGNRILIYHGHKAPNSQKKLALAKAENAQILISGHTHAPHLERYEDIILLNPGSPTHPLSKEKIPTLAFITENKIEVIDINSGKAVLSLER